MPNYYKLVCAGENKSEWLFSEYLAGRVRFGYGWPECDLRILAQQDAETLTDNQLLAWHYAQFLINKLIYGDCLILQFEEPLNKIVIARVTEGYDYDENEKEDFNQIVRCVPLCDKYIYLSCSAVSFSLYRCLSKKGEYFQIFAADAISEINSLIRGNGLKNDYSPQEQRTPVGYSGAARRMSQNENKYAPQKQASLQFQNMVCALIENCDNFEVMKPDAGPQGCDLLMHIIDPLSREILHAEVPVLCKTNITDDVIPAILDELETCVRCFNSGIVYLFVSNELSANMQRYIKLRRIRLSRDSRNDIHFIIIGKTQIAQLAAKSQFID